MSQFFTLDGQSTGVSASASVLPVNTQDWFLLGLTGLISLQPKGLSRVFPSTTVWKHQLFSTQPSLWICCCSVAQSCPTLCDLMDCSPAGLPVLHHLPEFAQTHIHWVGDIIHLSLISLLSDTLLSGLQGLGSRRKGYDFCIKIGLNSNSRSAKI